MTVLSICIHLTFLNSYLIRLYHISTRKSIVCNTYNRHYEKVGNNEPICIEDELPFEIPDSWKWVKIGNITYSVGSKENQILTSEILKQGLIPVVSQSQNLIDGYTNQTCKQIQTLPLIMFGDHTKVVKYIVFNFVIGADGKIYVKELIKKIQHI